MSNAAPLLSPARPAAVALLALLLLAFATAAGAGTEGATAPTAAPPTALQPASVAGADPAEQLRRTVRELEESFAAAFARRDREAFFALVHRDAVFLGDSGPLRGRDAVIAGWSGFFDGARAPFSWRPVVVEAHGDLGLTQGPVYDADGKWIANFSSVWQRQPDGRWQVVFDGAPPCRPLGEEEAAAPP